MAVMEVRIMHHHYPTCTCQLSMKSILVLFKVPFSIMWNTVKKWKVKNKTLYIRYSVGNEIIKPIKCKNDISSGDNTLDLISTDIQWQICGLGRKQFFFFINIYIQSCQSRGLAFPRGPLFCRTNDLKQSGLAILWLQCNWQILLNFATVEQFLKYRKIPKISLGLKIFSSPFLRGLFLEGLIFGGAYLQREIYSWK